MSGGKHELLRLGTCLFVGASLRDSHVLNHPLVWEVLRISSPTVLQGQCSPCLRLSRNGLGSSARRLASHPLSFILLGSHVFGGELCLRTHCRCPSPSPGLCRYNLGVVEMSAACYGFTVFAISGFCHRALGAGVPLCLHRQRRELGCGQLARRWASSGSLH